MNGVLVLNKPPQWTSHDVVARVRGLLKEKQIGHLGTLDPLATGVLPLAVGVATRLVEYASFDKEYVATCLLGKTTDSCDVTGKILQEDPVTGVTEDRIRQAVLDLKGMTEQVPPMVSAIKQGGQKLYDLARKGVTVERKPRPVRISEIEVLRVEIPRVSFRVVCSAGTYVRVLCQDLGETLRVGGCLETLERTRVGPFLLKDAVPLEKVGPEKLIPPSSLLGNMMVVELDGKRLQDLCQGKTVEAAGVPPGLVQVRNAQKLLCAIAEVLPEGLLKPRKVFGLEGVL